MPYNRVEITRPKGINVDLSPYELPNDLFSDGKNVTFQNFRTQVSDGYKQVFTDTTVKPIFMQPWTDFLQEYWFYADEDSIFRTQGTTQLNVTRLSGAYNTTLNAGWTGANFNGALIMSNPNDEPQFFNVNTAKMEDLPAWPADTTCATVRPFKNYLIALNIVKSSVNFENMVKWSDSVDAGGVPQSWDEADPSTDAGENILADSEGRVIDGVALADTFYIYKSDSVWGMNFVGGKFIFNFRKVFNSGGALSQDCVVEFNGKHFVVGINDVYVHDGSSKKSVISNKFKSMLYGQISESSISNIKAVGDHTNKEIWIYFPNTKSLTGQANTAIVYNYEVDEWTQREIPELTHISVGTINPQEPDDWDDSDLSWDNSSKSWGGENYNPSITSLLIADYNNNKFYQGNETRTFDGASYTGSVERIGIDFGDDLGFKYINSVTPHFSGGGTVDIYIGTESKQGEGVTWSAPVSFEVGVDYKANFRASGRYIAIRFESTSDNLWALTGYTLEYTNKGIR